MTILSATRLGGFSFLRNRPSKRRGCATQKEASHHHDNRLPKERIEGQEFMQSV